MGLRDVVLLLDLKASLFLILYSIICLLSPYECLLIITLHHSPFSRHPSHDLNPIKYIIYIIPLSNLHLKNIIKIIKKRCEGCEGCEQLKRIHIEKIFKIFYFFIFISYLNIFKPFTAHHSRPPSQAFFEFLTRILY